MTQALLESWTSEQKFFTMLYLVFGSPAALLLDFWLGRLFGGLALGFAEATGSRTKAFLLSSVCLVGGYVALSVVGYPLVIAGGAFPVPGIVGLVLSGPVVVAGAPLFSVPLVFVPLLAAVVVASFAANDGPFRASIAALLVGAFVWLGLFFVLYRSVLPG